MSAGTLQAVDVMETREREHAWRDALAPQPMPAWDLDRFAQEQIRGLVRQVFSSSHAPARQAVFAAVDSFTDVHGLCRRVGETLASSITGDVAIVGAFTHLVAGALTDPREMQDDGAGPAPLKQVSTRLYRNCWLLDAAERVYDRGESLHAYLAQIRVSFEYSILAAPPASESDEAVAMAQFSDGIILVLSAQHTRRAAARKVKGKLDEAHVRLLGTVLSDREFPIPQRLYRRL
jgi:hypothetical protein